MADILQDSDQFLVNRSDTTKTVTKDQLMAELQDTDLLAVNRNDVVYKITGKDLKDSVQPSDLPPVINSITLAGGPGFSGKSYVTTLNAFEGVPAASTTMKAKVTGALSIAGETSPITGVDGVSLVNLVDQLSLGSQVSENGYGDNTLYCFDGSVTGSSSYGSWNADAGDNPNARVTFTIPDGMSGPLYLATDSGTSAYINGVIKAQTFQTNVPKYLDDVQPGDEVSVWRGSIINIYGFYQIPDPMAGNKLGPTFGGVKTLTLTDRTNLDNGAFVVDDVVTGYTGQAPARTDAEATSFDYRLQPGAGITAVSTITQFDDSASTANLSTDLFDTYDGQFVAEQPEKPGSTSYGTYVYRGNSSSLLTIQESQGHWMECWFYKTTPVGQSAWKGNSFPFSFSNGVPASTADDIIYGYADQADAFLYFLNTDSAYTYATWGSGGAWRTDFNNLAQNEWHHIAYWIPGDQTNIYCYINGVQYPATSYSGSLALNYRGFDTWQNTYRNFVNQQILSPLACVRYANGNPYGTGVGNFTPLPIDSDQWTTPDLALMFIPLSSGGGAPVTVKSISAKDTIPATMNVSGGNWQNGQTVKNTVVNPITGIPVSDVITGISTFEGPIPRSSGVATVDLSAFMTANGITKIKGFKMNQPGSDGYGIAFYEFTTDGITYPSPTQLNVISETGSALAVYSWSNWGVAQPDAPYVQYGTATECEISAVDVGGTTTFKIQDYGTSSGHENDQFWVVDQNGKAWSLYAGSPETTLTLASDSQLANFADGYDVYQDSGYTAETSAITNVDDGSSADPPTATLTATGDFGTVTLPALGNVKSVRIKVATSGIDSYPQIGFAPSSFTGTGYKSDQGGHYFNSGNGIAIIGSNYAAGPAYDGSSTALKYLDDGTTVEMNGDYELEYVYNSAGQVWAKYAGRFCYCGNNNGPQDPSAGTNCLFSGVQNGHYIGVLMRTANTAVVNSPQVTLTLTDNTDLDVFEPGDPVQVDGAFMINTAHPANLYDKYLGNTDTQADWEIFIADQSQGFSFSGTYLSFKANEAVTFTYSSGATDTNVYFLFGNPGTVGTLSGAVRNPGNQTVTGNTSGSPSQFDIVLNSGGGSFTIVFDDTCYLYGRSAFGSQVKVVSVGPGDTMVVDGGTWSPNDTVTCTYQPGTGTVGSTSGSTMTLSTADNAYPKRWVANKGKKVTGDATPLNSRSVFLEFTGSTVNGTAPTDPGFTPAPANLTLSFNDADNPSGRTWDQDLPAGTKIETRVLLTNSSAPNGVDSGWSNQVTARQLSTDLLPEELQQVYAETAASLLSHKNRGDCCQGDKAHEEREEMKAKMAELGLTDDQIDQLIH